MDANELARELAAVMCPCWAKVSVVVKDADDRLAASLVVRADEPTPSFSTASPEPR